MQKEIIDSLSLLYAGLFPHGVGLGYPHHSSPAVPYTQHDFAVAEAAPPAEELALVWRVVQLCVAACRSVEEPQKGYSAASVATVSFVVFASAVVASVAAFAALESAAAAFAVVAFAAVVLFAASSVVADSTALVQAAVAPVALEAAVVVSSAASSVAVD